MTLDLPARNMLKSELIGSGGSRRYRCSRIETNDLTRGRPLAALQERASFVGEGGSNGKLEEALAALLLYQFLMTIYKRSHRSGSC